MQQRHKRACALLIMLVVAGCGGPDFEAIKGYKSFLEEAKEPLQKMNRVREELFQLSDPAEMQAKFKDDLLPAVKKLAKEAKDHETPEVKKLSEIHVTLRNVLKDYAEDTSKLVDALEDAAKREKDGLASAKKLSDETARTKSEAKAHSDADRAREAALVVWGEADQKFGSRMQDLVDSLTKYLDKQMKK